MEFSSTVCLSIRELRLPPLLVSQHLLYGVDRVEIKLVQFQITSKSLKIKNHGCIYRYILTY